MKAESPKDLVPQFFDKTAHTYDKVVSLTTFGKDKYWKKEILKKIPNCNSILDLACGTGILTFQIAENFPNSKIVAVDMTESYLNVAKMKLKPYHKITFLNQDAEKLNLDSKFDCITSSYIPKYCNPDILIGSCLSHLNRGGKIILHDFTYPKNHLVRGTWNFYFIVLKLIGYLVPSWKDVFANLPKLIRSTHWLADYENIMKKHGLKTTIKPLTLSTSSILTGTQQV